MCIPVSMCADGTAPHFCIPLVGVEVRLGTTVEEHNNSHMASSKPQKGPFEDNLSDEEIAPPMNLWPHFSLIQLTDQEKNTFISFPICNC